MSGHTYLCPPLNSTILIASNGAPRKESFPILICGTLLFWGSRPLEMQHLIYVGSWEWGRNELIEPQFLWAEF